MGIGITNMAVSLLPQSVVEPSAMAGALDRHIATTAAVFHRGLVTTLAAFDEPRAARADLAFRRLGYLVETLLGVAAGCVIGSVITEIRRGVGSYLVPAVGRKLREVLPRIGASRAAWQGAALTMALPAFLIDAETRPLVDELGMRLHARLAHASRDHHLLLLSCASAMPAENLPGFAASLARLEHDPMLEQQWTEHLRVAWCHYAAAVADAHDATPVVPRELATSTVCKTWQTWLARIRGAPAKVVDRPAPAGDYIMAVM